MLGILILSLLGFEIGCLLPGSWFNMAPADSGLPAAAGSLQATATILPGWIPTATPNGTGTPAPTYALPPTATPTPISSQPATPVAGQYSEDLIPRIDPPWGAQASPYVILSGFSLQRGLAVVTIRGTHEGWEFSCVGNRCELPVFQDSLITMRVYANNGDYSRELRATVRVTRLQQGYFMDVEELNPIPLPFTDTCAAVWDMDPTNAPKWAKFPASPDYLHTDKTLHYLAGQMIFTGAVDAQSCPGGGLAGGTAQGGPNGCGLTLAQNAMIEWQNRYDYTFWLTGKHEGIPPILLKTLIEVESQFWPRSERYFVQEYGLSQTNDLGADVALRWDVDLYKEVCSQVFSDCSRSYARRPPHERAMLRGILITKLDADCWTCENGIDVAKSEESIDLIAKVVRTNCIETDYILDTFNATTNYQDYWKFSLLNYHSGYSCLRDAISATVAAREPVTWDTVWGRLNCADSKEYVDRVWTALSAFDDSTIKPGQAPGALATPVFAATATPLAPTATPFVSLAQVYVRVYLDLNGNGQPETGEWLNNITVQMNLSNGVMMDARTVDGRAMFEVTGHTQSLDGVVFLPGLYRYEAITVPLQGSVTVDFAFSPPALPTAIP